MEGEGRRPNDSLLFSPDSDMDLLFAVLATVILLGLTVGPALVELSEAHVEVALLLLAVAGLPTVANLLRYKRAPMGCAVVPAGFLLYGLAYAAGASGILRTLLLAAPNVLFLAWSAALVPAKRRVEAAQALQAVAGLHDARALAPFLTHGSAAVCRAAAEAMLGLGSGALGVLEELRAGGDEAAAAMAARTLPGVDAGGPAIAAAAEDARGRVRLSLAAGLLLRGRDLALAARLLVDGLGDESAEVRQVALDTTDLPEAPEEHRRALIPALSEGLRARLGPEGSPTAELLWALAETGAASDAPLAARWAAADRPEVANAAVEAVSAIVNRGELGAAQAETVEALGAARDTLRAEHAEGENPLADRLVAWIEALESELA